MMGVDQCLDGGGQDNFCMGWDWPPWGGLGSHGVESPPSPPTLGNPETLTYDYQTLTYDYQTLTYDYQTLTYDYQTT